MSFCLDVTTGYGDAVAMTTNEQTLKTALDALTEVVRALADSHRKVYGDANNASPVPQAGPSLPTDAMLKNLDDALEHLTESERALALQ